MVKSGWLEEHWLMRDEWRCARVDSGGLCVMIFGDLQMLVWYAGSLATQDSVRLLHICKKYTMYSLKLRSRLA